MAPLDTSINSMSWCFAAGIVSATLVCETSAETSTCACRNQGCPDMACRICMENPNRRCRGNFADKYLAGDVLKATCGAPIRVEIINRTTGASPSREEYEDVYLEVRDCFHMLPPKYCELMQPLQLF